MAKPKSDVTRRKFLIALAGGGGAAIALAAIDKLEANPQATLAAAEFGILDDSAQILHQKQ